MNMNKGRAERAEVFSLDFFLDRLIALNNHV